MTKSIKNKTVIIEVQEGVAHVTKCPRGVTVKIIDHDIEASDERRISITKGPVRAIFNA